MMERDTWMHKQQASGSEGDMHQVPSERHQPPALLIDLGCSIAGTTQL